MKLLKLGQHHERKTKGLGFSKEVRLDDCSIYERKQLTLVQFSCLPNSFWVPFPQVPHFKSSEHKEKKSYNCRDILQRLPSAWIRNQLIFSPASQPCEVGENFILMVWLQKEMLLSNIFHPQVSWSESLKIAENFKLQWKNTKLCSH